MTREEAKKLLPFIQAFSEGKTIQSRCFTEEMPLWWDDNNPTFNVDDFDYRIKPEPKYRPFKSVEECWYEMQEHQPFGWLKSKTSLQTRFYSFNEICEYSNWDIRFNNYTFADGTPYGIKEE